MFLATIYFSNQARKAFRKARREIGSVNAELQESISSVREVQAFNRADENIEQFKLVNAANRDANVRAVAFTSALAPTLEAMSYLALAIVTGVGGWYLLQGTAAVGHGRLARPGGDLPGLRAALQPAHPADLRAVDQHPERHRGRGAHLQHPGRGAFGAVKPGAKDMPEILGKVEFDHVSSSYKIDEPVLNDVNFTAEPGQTVAIVGPTGAGKTTIINLIPRFWDPTEGRSPYRRYQRRGCERRNRCANRSASCCRIPSCSAPP
jgi:ATP-binding cassette, subfamily B, multidrug efflux pump